MAIARHRRGASSARLLPSALTGNGLAIIISMMPDGELDGVDGPVCPLLGMASDRRSHFTYPHPAHRCFAKQHGATTDARRQLDYCLSPSFASCDRFQAREHDAPAPEKRGSAPAEGDNGFPGATVPGSRAPEIVIYVSRVGDSLERVAATYGLTVEQIAQANGLAVDAEIAEERRLVIPLPTPSRGRSGRPGASNRGDGLD